MDIRVVTLLISLVVKLLRREKNIQTSSDTYCSYLVGKSVAGNSRSKRKDLIISKTRTTKEYRRLNNAFTLPAAGILKNDN